MWGFIPILLFNILSYFIWVNVAMALSLMATLFLFWVALRFLAKRNVYTFSILLSAGALIGHTIILLIPAFNILARFPNLELEIAQLMILVLMLINREHLISYVNQNFRPTVRMSVRTSLKNLFHVSRLLTGFYIIHLTASLIYLFMVKIHSPFRDTMLLVIIPPAAIVALFFYNQIRIELLYAKAKSERMLHVVDENGMVIGKVAYVEMEREKSTYCNPYVRIAIVSGNSIYLDQTNHEYDLPLQDYVEITESLDICTKRLMMKFNIEPTEMHYIQRYHLSTPHDNRMIYLCVVVLESEKSMEKMNCASIKSKGKFWIRKQIDDQIDSGIFSPLFIREYKSILAFMTNHPNREERNL